jgi:hypothetical protein
MEYSLQLSVFPLFTLPVISASQVTAADGLGTHQNLVVRQPITCRTLFNSGHAAATPDITGGDFLLMASTSVVTGSHQ